MDPETSREQLAGILQSAMDAIITVDAGQRIVLFNPAAEQMFRCTAEDALGQPIERFIPERFRGGHHGHVETFGHTNTTNRRMGGAGAVSGLRADGEEFPAEAAISQVEAGGRKLYTVILRDISVRKKLEEQLRQTERLAELGTLASGMAHEIGTPMNVILGRAEFLQRKTKDPDTAKGLQTIIDQVERITRIMNQLLVFARRRPIERRPMNLNTVVEETLEMLQERCKRHRIEVVTELSPALPQADADPVQISQVMLNLAMNALHAIGDGGTLRMRTAVVHAKSQTSNHSADMIEIAVSDTGHGIAPEDLDKIFIPFFTTKEVGKGTGLGLTVVHGIVQEHGGHIRVESEPQKGTTFRVFLPIATRQP
ncbi:MAG: PAS domain S-box protein [Nitrospirae bacterium]|nr:PAS domain S-box protein [Nitrospirota bacterium]